MFLFQALTKIVRRDFFPDIAKMEAQLEFIEATETNDYERLRAISERFPTSLRTPNPTSTPLLLINYINDVIMSHSPPIKSDTYVL